MPDPRDLELRQTAFEQVRERSRRDDDDIPVDELRKGVDGPMRRAAPQGFHGEATRQPRSRVRWPDPDRLEARHEQFGASA